MYFLSVRFGIDFANNVIKDMKFIPGGGGQEERITPMFQVRGGATMFAPGNHNIPQEGK
jgi:hypothetical protein